MIPLHATLPTLNGTPPDPLHRVVCPRCPDWRGSTLNDLSTHHLDAHERPLPAGQWEPWTIAPRLTPYVPPNWRAASSAEWYGQARRAGTV